MLSSVKSAAILSNSLPEKAAKRKGIRVLQFDFRLASHVSDSVPNMPTGRPIGGRPTRCAEMIKVDGRVG